MALDGKALPLAPGALAGRPELVGRAARTPAAPRSTAAASAARGAQRAAGAPAHPRQDRPPARAAGRVRRPRGRLAAGAADVVAAVIARLVLTALGLDARWRAEIGSLPRRMQIGVPKETAEGERRVALVPEVVRKLERRRASRSSWSAAPAPAR